MHACSPARQIDSYPIISFLANLSVSLSVIQSSSQTISPSFSPVNQAVISPFNQFDAQPEMQAAILVTIPTTTIRGAQDAGGGLGGLQDISRQSCGGDESGWHL